MVFDYFAIPHIKGGVEEVHILFDDPGQMTESPKVIERSKRDQSSSVDPTHHCEDSTSIPSEWNANLINCRQCKRELYMCSYLSHALLDIAPASLSENQALITAGGFLAERRNQCWSVTATNKPHPLPNHKSAMEETYMATLCQFSRKQEIAVFSRHRHLSYWSAHSHLPQADIYVQLKGTLAHSKISVHEFPSDADPDFAQVPQQKRA